MLYDPKWHIKTDLFALPSLVAWLETKDPHVWYNYERSGACLLHQYFEAAGFHWIALGHTTVRLDYKKDNFVEDIPESFQVVAGYGMHKARWTFGAALERARVELSNLPD